MKNTKERLEKAVRESYSLSEVLRNLEIKWSGGQQQHIRMLIDRHNLDTSHFLGRGINKSKVSTLRRPPDKILIKSHRTRREKTHLLRRALVAYGVLEKCMLCGLCESWNGLPLKLEIDHINRDWTDNRKENLRFLCPNCHSQV